MEINTINPITVNIVHRVCITCGAIYCVPVKQFEYILRCGGVLRCASGHKNCWAPEEGPTKGELQAENTDLKSRIVELRHELEMAEARNADSAAISPKKRRGVRVASRRPRAGSGNSMGNTVDGVSPEGGDHTSA